MASLDSYRHWLGVAKNIQGEADAAGVSRPRPMSNHGPATDRSLLDQFDELVTDSILRTASRKLFADGHYTQAIEAAFKTLNNAVKVKSGLTAAGGDSLMRQAFSANKPKLRFSELQTISESDEQRGYMELYAGAMTGIRNPRAHEHDSEDDPRVALELLTFANHLMRKLDTARKSRRRKRAS